MATYNDCSECPYSKCGCPMLKRSEAYRRKVCSLLTMGAVTATANDTHTTIKRTCTVCPNLGECSISQPGADVPPYSCPMMRMPIDVISFDTMRLQIPENPKYWARTLKTYLAAHRQ